ncbi:2-succinyl-5-enolpyruvyl-6-hydroxy-3-cyclohexene- 1-carboxylate synthase [Kocuria varians]|uniref:2-succinyl-5-enolpyruvyl-6-hydroxy-3-cyclohexene-1-carboxylate synthase n=2 Tax=Kocuria varians TaxID=1272 RepID=A0A4Y4CYS1_KOCVA|nr:2-succinyl-5-enolpyruvyl-6-hydroxy-3-cyclohexene- 1-carboxylate synthase [Kocuria varians]
MGHLRPRPGERTARVPPGVERHPVVRTVSPRVGTLSGMTSPSLLSATTVLRALVRRGMRHLVVAPGSRSAPLAYAAAAAHASGALSVHVRIDERDAAFTALGIARSTGAPTAVVTTSGTAVGELVPAVMEASHTGAPVVVLSADRPPELRGTGANQTTRQPGIFANFVRSAVDLLPVADPGLGEDAQREEIESFLTPVLDALHGTDETPSGPVHVNVALRDPLYPASDDDHRHLRSWADALVRDAEDAASGQLVWPRAHPWSVADEPLLPEDAAAHRPPEARPVSPRPGTAHPVVLAGDGAGAVTARFAHEHGLPLLAEPSSNARTGEVAIASYESLLASSLGARVDAVILVGRPTLSRRVSALLRRPDVRVVAVRPDPVPWLDPGRGSETEVRSFAEALAVVGTPDAEWLPTWQESGAVADAAVLRHADAHSGLTRLHVARAVWDASCQDGSALVVGSSNIVRDLDLVARAQDPLPVVANRGVAGIDGTIATAHGVALGTGRPVRAVMGDLTFLHDAGGLLLGTGEQVPDVHVVVVNDAGGGIFQTLEHGAVGQDQRYAAAVERFFGTPHEASIAELCAAYGLEYGRADSAIELTAALAAPVVGRRVVEVPLERETLREFNLAAHEVGARAVEEFLAGQ